MHRKMHVKSSAAQGAAFVALLAGGGGGGGGVGVGAAPTTTVSAAAYAGANTADVYPPVSSKSTHVGSSFCFLLPAMGMQS